MACCALGCVSMLLTLVTISVGLEKSRRPGTSTTTFESVFYSAAAIKLDQLKSSLELSFFLYELSFFLYHVYHIERPDESAASLLHCTFTAFLGHTQTRVDLRVAPLLL